MAHFILLLRNRVFNTLFWFIRVRLQTNNMDCPTWSKGNIGAGSFVVKHSKSPRSNHFVVISKLMQYCSLHDVPVQLSVGMSIGGWRNI